MTDLRARIEHAIARVTFAKAADEVLKEIATTHLLIERDGLRERIVESLRYADHIDDGSEGWSLSAWDTLSAGIRAGYILRATSVIAELEGVSSE